jgi:hypothetical protein
MPWIKNRRKKEKEEVMWRLHPVDSFLNQPQDREEAHEFMEKKSAEAFLSTDRMLHVVQHIPWTFQ